MKMFRGYMKNEHKKNIFIIIAAVAFCIVLSGNICNSVQSYKLGRLCNEYRKSLTATEEANRELTNRIGRIAEITGRIKETTDANITDTRGVIETVEKLRAEVNELEDYCGSFNQLDYYNYLDNELCISQ